MSGIKKVHQEGAPVDERRDEVIKRMLATPPKPHDPGAKKKGREPKPAPPKD